MGLLIFCCPRALVTNLTELTITSYAWMRAPDDMNMVTTAAPTKRKRFPNIERMMKAEWDFRNVKENIIESRDGNYCIICFDSFEHVKEAKLIPCGHKEICPKCAIRLISIRGKNTTCPQCRHVVWKYVVMEDDTKKIKTNKNKNTTLVLEDCDDNKKPEIENKSNVIRTSTETTEGIKTLEIRPERIERRDRHCRVCFRPFCRNVDSSSFCTFPGSVSERGFKVRETRLYPCGHEEVCVTCAGLITLKEVNRECPQCRRFVRRFITLEQTENGP